jgi:hypothetical protein
VGNALNEHEIIVSSTLVPFVIFESFLIEWVHSIYPYTHFKLILLEMDTADVIGHILCDAKY